jgi:arylsulfatase A-like enzyme
MRLRYDEFIHYCDDEFGQIIESLRRSGMLDTTMIILSADHGESFEDGFYGHRGPLLLNQLIRVPCIIYVPGMAGRRVAANAESIDIAPTILDALALPKPDWMQGESLLPYMRGQKDRTDKPKYAMQLEGNSRFAKAFTRGTAAVMLDSLKLIYRADNDTAQLFDLAKDPREETDIAAALPEEARRLKALIKKDIFSENPTP